MISPADFLPGVDYERPEYKNLRKEQIEQVEMGKEMCGLKEYGIDLTSDHLKGYMYRPEKFETDDSASKTPWEAPILATTGPSKAARSESVEKWNNSEFLLEVKDGIAYATLNRPENNNAMNDGIGAGIHDTCYILRKRPDIRVLVLTGKGRMFCAGGDPKSFQAAQKDAGAIEGEGGEAPEGPPSGESISGTFQSLTGSSSGNAASAQGFSRDMYDLATLPQFVILCMNGSAMGGGVGLMAACDYVVAVKTAHCTLSEVKLGVIPAVISPHVIRTMGVANAKRLFCTAENCNMAMAMEYGLVQRIVNDLSEFPAVVKEIAGKVQACAPGALSVAKQVILDTLNQPISESLIQYSVREYVRVRKGKECEEGMKALLSKKKPSWVENKIQVKES